MMLFSSREVPPPNGWSSVVSRAPYFPIFWRHGGWRYRLSLIAIVVGLALSMAAGALLLAELVRQAGVAFLGSLTIIAIANYKRFQIDRRFRDQEHNHPNRRLGVTVRTSGLRLLDAGIVARTIGVCRPSTNSQVARRYSIAWKTRSTTVSSRIRYSSHFSGRASPSTSIT